MRRFYFILTILIIGYLFYGSVLIGPKGFGIYLKREASLNCLVCDVGPTTSIERLLRNFHHTYWILVIGYHSGDGIRVLRKPAVLP
jgi:hypothetical protein